MRIGIVGFMHESNTFAQNPTTLQGFEEAYLDYGADLVPTWREAHHEIGGFLEGCEREGFEAVPILAAWATPGGALTEEVYEKLVADIETGLDAAGELDGLLLALHGAMVCESFLNADGETVERLRKKLGPDFPIVLSLDMHANVSERMVEGSTATVIYRTYPHVDQRERGLECARLMAGIVRDEIRPVQALRKPPVLVHIVQQYSEAGPMAKVMEKVRDLANSPGILSASFAPGFVYADVPDMGPAVVVVADGEAERAGAEADRIADYVISIREELNLTLPSPEEAVRMASETPGLVSMMDCGDNIGGGAPGDSTILFCEILRQNLSNACVVLFDPDSVGRCVEAGVGKEIELEVGGKTDDLHGAPIPIRGRVRSIHEGTYVEPEARHGGNHFFDQGRTVVVETEYGHTVVLNSLRIMPTSLVQLTSLGVDVTTKKTVIVKGATAPRAAYEPVSAKTIAVDTPGVTQAGPESFTYKNRPAPLYPLDGLEGV